MPPITSLPGGPEPDMAALLAEGEIIPLEEDPAEAIGEQVTDTDDGGAIITPEEDPEKIAQDDWFANLVETIDKSKLETITSELIDLIEADKESRKDFDEIYAEGIKRTGLGEDAPGGATFQGASRVVHPMLSKAAIDYNSRSMGELFPAGGEIVRDQVLGQSDDYNFDSKNPEHKKLGDSAKPMLTYAERCDKAVRIKNLMNWQLVHDIPEFRLEMDKLLTQTPLSGSQFLFWIWDERRKRPTCRYWPTDHVWFDYGAPSALAAERLTLAEEISGAEFKRRVRRGEYILPVGMKDMPGSPSPLLETEADQATNKAQGVKHAWDVKAGFHLMTRTFCYMELDEAEGEAPYTIVMDLANNRMVSLVRNWEEEDDRKESLQWVNEVPFLPWRGALSIGLVQFIGSLAGASTGAARALLDSGHLNNFPAILKLKGANFPGQSQTVEATGVVDVEGGIAGDADIRKMMMPLPYNQPSPVLFQLLGWAAEEGSGFVQTAIKDLAEGKRDMPVGTTLALIEQGLKTLSGIHARLHNAMGSILLTVYRLNRMYIEDEEIRNQAGVLLARRSDFQGPMDVVPVSDPEVFSDAQRFAQLQIVAERAAAMPALYKLRDVEMMILTKSRIPNAKSLLIEPPEPTEQNAVTENVRMSMGQPCAAYPQQDHLAHLQVLLDFIQDPLLGSNPLIAPKYLPLAMQHAADHIVMWYANEFDKTMSPALQASGVNVQEAWDEQDPAVRAELDRTFAAASSKVVEQTSTLFGKVPPIIEKAQAILAKYQMPIAMDPSQAQLQTAQIKAQSEQRAGEVDLQKTQIHEEAETQRNTQDNETKLAIADMEVQLTRERTAAEAQRSAVEDEHRATERNMDSINRFADRQAGAQQSEADRAANKESGDADRTEDSSHKDADRFVDKESKDADREIKKSEPVSGGVGGMGNGDLPGG